MRRLSQLIKDDDGPAAVEYAIMMAMILGVCIATISAFGGSTGASFASSAGEIEQKFQTALESAQ